MGEFRRCRFNGCWGMSDADHGWCGIHERTQLSVTNGDAERAKLAAAQKRAARREMDMTQNQRDRLYAKRARRKP
jgi:hypothetical protein